MIILKYNFTLVAMKFVFYTFFFISSFNAYSHHPGHKIEANVPYPSIDMEIYKDSIDGYNLFIDLKNFTLDPSQVGRVVKANTGHLNLFVNEIKIGRIYSNWFHIPQRFFNLEENNIKVTLNSNLHEAFTIEDEPIFEELIVIID
tara:strand:- start:93 stop:527 length:435 start_codon:yes stop_codon:yes gene_type:complete